MGIFRQITSASEYFLCLEIFAFVAVCENKWYFTTSTQSPKNWFRFSYRYFKNKLLLKISKYRRFLPNSIYIMRLTAASTNLTSIDSFRRQICLSKYRYWAFLEYRLWMQELPIVHQWCTLIVHHLTSFPYFYSVFFLINVPLKLGVAN